MFKKIIGVPSIILGSFGLLGAGQANPAPAVSKDPNKVVLTADNVVVMNTYFDWTTTASAAQKAKELDSKLPSGEPIYLVIDSGGGSIDAGLELIENLNALNRPVNTLTIFAASMGFQTVEGVSGERLILENGTLMTHKAKGGFSGEFPGQLDSRYVYYLKRIFRLDQKVVDRSGGKHTLKSYQALYENEYWCDGRDCIEQGFADRVVSASCSESLKGSAKNIEDRFLFMGATVEISVERSKCPMVTGVLGFNVYIDGKPLFSSSIGVLEEKNKPLQNATEREAYWYSKNYDSKVLSDFKDSEIELLKKEIYNHTEYLTSPDRRVVRSY